MKTILIRLIPVVFAFVVASAGAVAIDSGRASAAEQTVHVRTSPLNEVQDACLDTGGEITSWTFVINQIRTGPKPDPITVVFDTDGDGLGDVETQVSPGPQGGRMTAHYTVSGTGVVVDAYGSIDAGWTGNFNLSHVDCGPPLDACTEFGDRIVIRFDTELGDPSTPYGLVAETAPIAVAIPAGTYAVTLQSFDEHSIKGGQMQFQEQWFARFTLEGGATVDTAAIGDLPDDEDVLNQQVGEVTFAADATEVVARHLLAGTPTPWTKAESVWPTCLALDPVR